MLRLLTGVLLMSCVARAADDVPARLSLSELRAKWGQPQIDKLVNMGDLEVVFRDEGQGPAILLIHGSSSTLRTYDAMAAALKDRYRVIRYDIPPHGLSGPVPKKIVGVMRPSDVPARLLRHLGVAKATVVGVSSGGTTGIFLAAEHPTLVERLVVSNAPADLVEMSNLRPSPALAKAQEIYGAYGDTSKAKPRHYWRTYWDFYAEDPTRISESIVDQFYDFNRRAREENATALIGVVADQAKAIAAAGAVRVPTLIIWGAADPLLPGPGAADALAKRFSNTEISMVQWPDVNHYPPIEVPDRFAAAVAEFITADAKP